MASMLTESCQRKVSVGLKTWQEVMGLSTFLSSVKLLLEWDFYYFVGCLIISFLLYISS